MLNVQLKTWKNSPFESSPFLISIFMFRVKSNTVSYAFHEIFMALTISNQLGLVKTISVNVK